LAIFLGHAAFPTPILWVTAGEYPEETDAHFESCDLIIVFGEKDMIVVEDSVKYRGILLEMYRERRKRKRYRWRDDFIYQYRH
jgi:hypothetical protein